MNMHLLLKTRPNSPLMIPRTDLARPDRRGSVFTIALAVTTLAFGFAPAQEEREEKIDLAERQRSIPILEGHIKEREERLTEITGDIQRLDKRVESKIDRIVQKLAGLKDSDQSGYRMSQVKMQAIEGLKKSIKTYQDKRSSLITTAREGRTGIPLEVLEGDAEKFNARIEVRVAQILEISQSFTQEKDVKKYEKVAGGGYSWGGWNEDLWGISDEWRQNRRDRTMDKKQRDEVIGALKKAIERHESRISDLNVFLNRKMSAVDRTLLESELKQSEEVLEVRKEQFREMMEVGQPNTSSVTRNEAHDFQNALTDAGADLRHDMETIFSKYAELNRERSNVYRAKSNLEARKVWIADYIKDCEKNGVKP